MKKTPFIKSFIKMLGSLVCYIIYIYIPLGVRELYSISIIYPPWFSLVFLGFEINKYNYIKNFI